MKPIVIADRRVARHDNAMAAMHDRRDREAANQIDDERAVGEGAAEPLSRPDGDQVASTSAGGAGQADPNESFHVASPLGDYAGTHSYGHP